MDSMAAGLMAGKTELGTEEDEMVRDATGGGQEPIRWVVIASTTGTPNAIIISGRLETHGLLTRVTQEAAGARAFAINVGILGTAYVWVPAEQEQTARAILEQEWDEEE